MASATLAYNHTDSPGEPWVLDPNVSYVASDAAFALDKLRLGRSSDLSSVKKLVEMLGTAGRTDRGHPLTLAAIDAVSADALRRTLRDVPFYDSGGTFSSLKKEILRLLKDFDQILADPGNAKAEDLVEHLRDFCLALSEYSASFRSVGYGETPIAP